MKIKTAELSGSALDWAVGLAQGMKLNTYGVGPSIRARALGLGVYAPWRPSYYWNQGGPIIENARITTSALLPSQKESWFADMYDWEMDTIEHEAPGPTPLIAAMRCYVASKLGEEVEIPSELL